MRYGVDVPTTGEYADARVLADLAADAEAAGWDGFFIWDVLGGAEGAVDPWIALAAIALRTTQIRLGTLATPLARHRPWLVARRLADLDRLSNGRVICAAGLGMPDDFETFGETSDAALRAIALDEALEILAGLWSGTPFSYSGDHYQLTDAILAPVPVQRPRIPIWVAGGWPRRGPFRRAARWDGVCVKSVHADTRSWLALDDFRACVEYIRAQRTSTLPFDVIASGELPDERPAAQERVASLADAGATWWVEEGLGWSLDEFRERVRSGPPR